MLVAGSAVMAARPRRAARAPGRKPRVPSRLRGVEQQPRAAFVSPAASRAARSNAAAAVAYELRSRLADPGLLERRRRRARRCRSPPPPGATHDGRRRGRAGRPRAPGGRRAAARRTRRRTSPTGRADAGTRPLRSRSVISPAPSAAASASRSSPSRRAARSSIGRSPLSLVAARTQRRPRGLVEVVEAAQERARDPRGHQDRGSFGRELEVLRVGCELDQRQRVAGGRAVEAVGDGGREPCEQHRRLVAGQTPETQSSADRRRRGARRRPRAPRSGPRSDRPPAAGTRTAAPARSSRRPSGRRRSAPRPGPRSAYAASRLSVAAPTAKRSWARPPAERERALERERVRLGDLVEHRQRRAQQLEQRGERDLRLGLDAARAQHPHPGRSLGRVVEQNRLADPRLSHQRERRARRPTARSRARARSPPAPASARAASRHPIPRRRRAPRQTRWPPGSEPRHRQP